MVLCFKKRYCGNVLIFIQHAHFSAINFSSSLLEYLVKDVKCDPNLATLSDQTGLTIARGNQQAIQLLLAYGANPPYDAWCEYLLDDPGKPTEAHSKLLFLGDPGVGKTSLIKSLTTETGSMECVDESN